MGTKTLNRFMWLFFGMMTGALLTAISSQAKPAPVHKAEFKVLAVSLEDAQDKARERVREGRVELPKHSVVAARVPQCHASLEHESYDCQVQYHLKQL